MYLRGIWVDVSHPYKQEEESNVDIGATRVFLPNDWEEYGAQLRESFRNHGGIVISMNTADAGPNIAIAFGNMNKLSSACDALYSGDAFGFVIDQKTLIELHAALTAAIIAAKA